MRQYTFRKVDPYPCVQGVAEAQEHGIRLQCAWHKYPAGLGQPLDQTIQEPPLVIILRGAPGAGKSTWAMSYKAKYPDETVVISATNYFRGWDGIVRFQQAQLQDSHTYCNWLFAHLLSYRIPRIIVDNTHIQHWEYRYYWLLCASDRYRCFQHVCTGEFPNTSGVPEQKVQEMRKRFEADTRLMHYQISGDFEPHETIPAENWNRRLQQV